LDVIRAELQAVLAQYGDERRTQIVESRIDFTREDLIPEEQVVLTVSKSGYAKTQPLEDYAAQRRGGRGKSATSMKEDDYIEHLVVASNHATVLCFTTRGKVYWLKTYDVPQASRGSKGRPLVNLLPLEDGEGVTAILPLREYPDNHFVFMATASGTVKRVDLEQFSRPRSAGLIAIDLNDDDTLIGVAITDGEQQIMLFSNEGKAIRFPETEVRSMGRTAQGVRGMRIEADSRIVSLVVAPEDGEVLTACANGYGKRTPVDAFPTRHRGGQGVIAVQTSDRNGELVRATAVNDDNEMLLISDGGTMVRTRVKEVRSTGRNAQGVMLIRLDVKEVLVGVVCIDCVGDDEDESDLDAADLTVNGLEADSIITDDVERDAVNTDDAPDTDRAD
jgi:DNA gyrase subunit A